MSLDTNALMRAARCFDCLPPSTQEEVQTYLIAYAAGLGSDPDNLARLAKCMKCLSPSTLREVRAYLLAVISGGSTDPNTLAQEAKCYTCIPDGMLGAVETYLWSTDPAGPGITDPNALAFAARFFQKLNSPTLLEIQVYALAVSAGTGTDPNTLASLAKCFKCLPLPFLRNVGEFLIAAVEPGGGGGGEGIGCTDVPADLVPVITGNYTAGAITSLNITFPKVCCTPLGWIAVQGDLADLSDGTSIGGGLDTVGHGGESNFSITANITGGFFTPITKAYVGVIQQCSGGVNSAVSNAVNRFDGTAIASEWADRVVTNGGVRPANSTISAAATLVASMMTAGIWTKMKHINIVAPDNLTAFRTPFLKTIGTNDPYTASGAPTLSLTVNGVSYTNGTYVPGINLSTDFASDNDLGCSFYVFSDSSNGSGMFGDYSTVGQNGFLGWYRHTSNNTGFCSYNILALQISAARVLGYQSINRSASNVLRFYRASSINAHSLIASDLTNVVGTRPNNQCFIFGMGQDGLLATFFDGRCSFFCLHTALTQTESLALFNGIQAYRTALGGGAI